MTHEFIDGLIGRIPKLIQFSPANLKIYEANNWPYPNYR